MRSLHSLIFLAILLFTALQSYSQKVYKLKDGKRLELEETGRARYYDKKGRLKSEGKMTNSLRTGEWKFYKENEVLSGVENYKLGKLDGLARYYYPGTAQLQAEGGYSKGNRTGEWKFYAYKNGLLYASINYVNGKVHGPAVYYDTIRGHKIGEGLHANGSRTGEWFFYANLTGKRHGIELYENGLMEGAASYYDTVNICEDAVCTKTADGQYEKNLRIGLWTFYYTPSGRLNATETYKDSILNGPAKYYCESTGKLTSEGNYEDGLAMGNWSFYDSISGRKLYQLAFANDVDTATIEFFDDNRGLIKSIQRYKGDILNGDHEEYDSLTGNLVNRYCYQNDVITGFYYYKNGGLESYNNVRYNGDSSYLVLYNTECDQKKSEGFYKDTSHSEGRIIFYYQCSEKIQSFITKKGQAKYLKHYDSLSGKPLIEGGSINGKRSGEWKYYYQNSGRVCSTMVFRNDIVDGNVNIYDSLTGKVVMQGYFKNGERDGDWVLYAPGTGTGTPLLKEKYVRGDLNGKQVMYDTTGNVFFTYLYKDGKKDGPGLMNYYGSSQKWIETNYKNDLLDGRLRSFYADGKLKREEKYTNGVLVSSKCYAPNGDTTAYYPILIQPEFEEDVMNYIGRNLRYPVEAIESKAEGKVTVRFKIHETGMVSDAEIIKSAGHGMDEEAIRIISQMPPWAPAHFDGVPFATYKILPVVFWLPDQRDN